MLLVVVGLAAALLAALADPIGIGSGGFVGNRSSCSRWGCVAVVGCLLLLVPRLRADDRTDAR